MKRIGCSLAFLTLLSVHVLAQVDEPKKKGREGYLWGMPQSELKMPQIDTLQQKISDSISIKGYHGVQPVEIPNVYNRQSGNFLAYKMPVAKLSGKNCAPMPGTEKLDKIENYQRSVPRLKTQPLLIK